MAHWWLVILLLFVPHTSSFHLGLRHAADPPSPATSSSGAPPATALRLVADDDISDAELEDDLFGMDEAHQFSEKMRSQPWPPQKPPRTSSTSPSQQETPLPRKKWKNKRYLMMKDVQDAIRRKDRKAPEKAKALIERIERMHDRYDMDVFWKPNTMSYNLWLHALAKSGRANAGRSAEDVLRQMEAVGAIPDLITYSTVLDAYANSEDSSSVKAEAMLKKLLDATARETNVKASTVTCDTILNVWAKEGTQEGAERAQDMLFRLETLQRDGIRPTIYSYATVINAWAEVGSRDAAEQAEYLLDHAIRKAMDEAKRKPRGRDEDDEPLRLDTTTFNAAIKAWANSKDPQAGSKATALLQRMEELSKSDVSDIHNAVQPDIVTYNTVLSTWSHCGHMNAALQAEKVLAAMQRNAKRGNGATSEAKVLPVPNTISFNSVLHAWSVSPLEGAAIRAQKILDFMIVSSQRQEKRRDSKAAENVKPDIISFTSVLNAWAKSKEPYKARKARDLLDRLEVLCEDERQQQQKKTTNKDNGAAGSLQPTVFAYNTVLNACAFSALGTQVDEQRDALQIAVGTFGQLRRSAIAPDTVTYGNLLKCFANLMPAGQRRTQMALQVFDKCREDGMVGALAWNELRRAVPNRALVDALELSRLPHEVRDLPWQWRRANLKDKNAPQKKQQQQKRQQKGKKNEVGTRQRARQRGFFVTESMAESGKDL